MKKINIYSIHNTQNAYSCLIYLKNELDKRVETNLWSFTEYSNEQKEKGYHSFLKTWYGHIRRFRLWMAPVHAFFLNMWNNDAMIINDLDFFIPAYILKKIRPDKPIIHYNTEIHGPDVKYPKYITNFYNKHANFPDMIIECLKERALYRKKKFHITKKIYVINNTLPLRKKEQKSLYRKKVENYIKFSNNHPILLYAGGCNLSRNLGDIIESIEDNGNQLNYLFFCYGSERDFNAVYKKCEKYIQDGSCLLYKAIDRELLLKIMESCDIGIIYYDTKISANHLYAAPSKFFEYISAGLNVISTNNEGINKIIKKSRLGICMDEDETLSHAIARLLEQGLQSRDEIMELFEKEYCYDVDSKTAVNAIVDLLI